MCVRRSLHPSTQSFVVVIKVIAYSRNVIGETDNSYELFLNVLTRPLVSNRTDYDCTVTQILRLELMITNQSINI